MQVNGYKYGGGAKLCVSKKKSDVISNKCNAVCTNVTTGTHDDNDDSDDGDDKAVNKKVRFVNMYEATHNVKTSSTFASNAPEVKSTARTHTHTHRVSQSEHIQQSTSLHVYSYMTEPTLTCAWK